MNFSVDASIIIAIRVLIGLVFAGALIGKLRHRQEFAGVVANYRLLPEFAVRAGAWLVMLLEAAVLPLLAFNGTVRSGAVLGAALLLGFAVVITINLARGRTEIDCGCFQAGLRHRLSVTLVVRNLLLVGVCVPLLESSAQDVVEFQLLNGLCAGVALFVLYNLTGQMFALMDQTAAFRKRFP